MIHVAKYPQRNSQIHRVGKSVLTLKVMRITTMLNTLIESQHINPFFLQNMNENKLMIPYET